MSYYIQDLHVDPDATFEICGYVPWYRRLSGLTTHNGQPDFANHHDLGMGGFHSTIYN